jgi:hypothetical protein
VSSFSFHRGCDEVQAGEYRRCVKWRFYVGPGVEGKNMLLRTG